MEILVLAPSEVLTGTEAAVDILDVVPDEVDSAVDVVLVDPEVAAVLARDTAGEEVTCVATVPGGRADPGTGTVPSFIKPS